MMTGLAQFNASLVVFYVQIGRNTYTRYILYTLKSQTAVL